MRRTSAFLLFALLLSALLIAGCSGGLLGGRNRNQYIDAERAKYFEGYEGVEARYDQFPSKLYYYGDAPGSSANEFPFSVEVWNKGSSYSRGAVFISGYDPTMIEIDKIPIGTSYNDACSVRIGDYALNSLSAIFQCGDWGYARWNEGRGLQSLMVYGKQWFDDGFLSKLRINLNQFNNGQYTVDFGFDDFTTYAQLEHGIKLIAILSGLSFANFLGQEYLLAGDTYDYPGGELDFVPYTGRFVSWPQGADEIPQHFLLTNCYMYTTFAAPVVCIDPQPYAENRKVCTPAVATWTRGQGAPVAITRVTQENTPRTAVFHIEVKNVGQGTVFDPGSLEKCSPYYRGGAKQNDLNTVWVGEVRIGDRQLDCTTGPEIRLVNGQGEFTCTYPIQYAELTSAYQTPLVVELWYGYSTVTDKFVTVKRIT